jgi:hypothetical protein
MLVESEALSPTAAAQPSWIATRMTSQENLMLFLVGKMVVGYLIGRRTQWLVFSSVGCVCIRLFLVVSLHRRCLVSGAAPETFSFVFCMMR